MNVLIKNKSRKLRREVLLGSVIGNIIPSFSNCCISGAFKLAKGTPVVNILFVKNNAGRSRGTAKIIIFDRRGLTICKFPSLKMKKKIKRKRTNIKTLRGVVCPTLLSL